MVQFVHSVCLSDTSGAGQQSIPGNGRAHVGRGQLLLQRHLWPHTHDAATTEHESRVPTDVASWAGPSTQRLFHFSTEHTGPPESRMVLIQCSTLDMSQWSILSVCPLDCESTLSSQSTLIMGPTGYVSRTTLMVGPWSTFVYVHGLRGVGPKSTSGHGLCIGYGWVDENIKDRTRSCFQELFLKVSLFSICDFSKITTK